MSKEGHLSRFIRGAEQDKYLLRDVSYSDIQLSSNSPVYFNNIRINLMLKNVAFRNCSGPLAGAVYAKAGFVEITETTGVKCRSSSAAFMNIEASQSSVITDISVRSCYTPNNYVIYVAGSCVLDKCEFSENVASDELLHFSQAKITHLQFKDNKIKKGGCAISAKTFTISDSTIQLDDPLLLIDFSSTGTIKYSTLIMTTEQISASTSNVEIESCNFQTPKKVTDDDNLLDLENLRFVLADSGLSDSESFLEDDDNDQTTFEESSDEPSSEVVETPLPTPTPYDPKTASLTGMIIGCVIVFIILVLLVIRLIPGKKKSKSSDESNESLIERKIQHSEEEENPLEFQFTTHNDAELLGAPKKTIVIEPVLDSDEMI